MRRVIAFACMGLIVLGIAGRVSADAFDDAAKALDDSYAKIKSFTAKVKTVQDIEMSGMRMKSDSSGTLEWMRKGDKALYRSEITYTAVQTMGGKDEKSDARMLIVCDGDLMWSLNEYLSGPMKGQKMVMKARAQPISNGCREIKNSAIVKLLPDEKVDGQACCVIEGLSKGPDGKPNDGGRTLWYFRKDYGMAIKTVFLAGDKPQSTSTTSDVVLNASIAADHFKFTVPEGAQVTDLTAQTQPPADPSNADKPAAEPKAEEKKPEDKKPEEPKKDEPKKDDKPKEESKGGLKLPKLPKLP